MATPNNDIIYPANGGLNTDDDLLVIGQHDSRSRLNVVSSDDYNFNVLTSVLGNLLKDNNTAFVYPAGNLRVIGFVENKEEKAAIFFVYSSTGEHSIIQYFSETDTLQYILRGGSGIIGLVPIGDILNFQADKFIDAGIIGNETDKYLIWTDGYNEPRIVNIYLATNYTNNLTPDYAGIFSTELMAFYKKPYLGYVRFFSSAYDSGFGGNNISGKIFQFCVRLKYYDNTYSPLSPYSNFYTVIDEMPSGRLSDATKDNVIYVQMDFDNHIGLVDSYQLLFRIVDIGGGTPGNWYIYDNYDYTATGFVSKSFYNEKNLGVISDAEVTRYYDYVPDFAGHVGIIDSNRAVLGNVTEGYPNVNYDDPNEWDVSLACTEVALLSSNEGIVYQHDDLIDNGGTNPTSVVFTFSESATSDRYWFFSITEVNGPTITTEQYIEQSSFNQTSSNIFTKIRDFVNALPFEVTASYTSPSLTITINIASTRQYLVGLFILGNTGLYFSAKTGATYKFGIRYGYNGKLGYVQTDDSLKYEVPYYSDLSSTFTNYYLRFDLTIDYLAPIGATEYQIVSFGNNIDYYEKYMVYCNFADITDSSSPYTIYSDGTNTIIKRDEMVNRFRAAYNDGIDYGFDFEVGDKVRLIGRFSNTLSSGAVSYDVELFSTKYEYEIVSVTASEIKLSYSALSGLDLLYSGDTSILIEILRLKDQFDTTAQEFSEVFSIGTDRRHNANYQNQTSSVPAIVRITDDFADCYKTKQVFLNELNYLDYGFGGSAGGQYCWMEKPRMSLYYDSYPLSIGRLNVVNENAETKTYNKIRWGGKFLEDSGYNFMSVFGFADEKMLDDRNGNINKIQQIGDTLKVYQERMTNSFYLKTTSSQNADGSQTYVFSDNIMSDARQSVFEYGCTHFTSYTKTTREAFYFDIINSTVIKDTPSGPVVISDIKMHSYFKEKVQDILNYGVSDILILGGYDEDLDMFLLSFVDPGNLSDPINETIGYYIPGERWVSFYSYHPEYYGKISGKTAITFLGGKLYLQNSNPLRGNFFGSQYESYADIHINANEIKIFDSISIISTGQWSPDQDGDIEINLPDFMQSRLLPGKFVRQEGMYNSEFLRDALVKDGIGGTTFDKRQLQYGRFLRGHEMRVRLRNSDTGEASLRLVIVKSTFSK